MHYSKVLISSGCILASSLSLLKIAVSFLGLISRGDDMDFPPYASLSEYLKFSSLSALNKAVLSAMFDPKNGPSTLYVNVFISFILIIIGHHTKGLKF